MSEQNVRKFLVNHYITLKLENGMTNIFVMNDFFNQCKSLLLNITVDDIKSLDEIESIDEASEKLVQPLDHRDVLINKIPPEVEFWGHCSNLQVWAENNYDTRLLHRNLAFPLLKKLTDVGDPTAKKVFKEEIVKRLQSGHLPEIKYLIEQGYLNYLNKDEFEVLISNITYDPIFLLEDIHIHFDFKKIIVRKIIEDDDISKLLSDKFLEFLPNPLLKNNERKYISFRNTKIPLKEAMGLKNIEDQINNQWFKSIKRKSIFELVDEFNYCDSEEDWYKTQFIVKNNRVSAISIEDPNNCEGCADDVRKGEIDRPSYTQCHNCGLKKIPHSIGVFDCLEELYIETDTFHGFKELPETIGNLKNLKKMVLRYNRLETLPESFGNLESLEYLKLCHTRLKDLPESISRLKSLKKLIIIDSLLENIPNSIGNLNSLEEFIINGVQFKKVPESICDLKSLKILKISGSYCCSSSIEELPESLGNLINLKKLVIDSIQLKKLPESIGNLSSLKELCLRENKLTTLPESIGNLSSLQTLYLNGIKLTTLPESIGNLSSLQGLYLRENKLTTLPESIGNLSSLKKLWLEWNQLSTLPESIGDLSSLKKLDFRGNKLTTLPESIGNLTSLTYLSFSNNNLTTLPESIKILEKRGVKIYSS